MSKKNVVRRSYTITDSEMVLASSVLREIFIKDKLAFTQFDSGFADPFSDNWAETISKAETVAQDAELIDQMAQLTAIVNSKMADTQRYYQQLKYYMEKAFPNDIAIQNEFGRNDYEKARNSTPKLIAFMQTLNNAITKYTTNLLAASCKQEFLDEAPTLHNNLRTAENNQEVFKKSRPVETQNRLKNMNNCWSFYKNVSKAGKIIFSDNSAKYNQYLLPGETPKATTESVPE